MITRPPSQKYPGAFSYERTDISAGLTIREWRQPDAQQSRSRRPLPGAVAAIKMSGYPVIVTKHCCGLVDSSGTTYFSPPQPEDHEQSVIALLAGATAAVGGGGPWRPRASGSQRIIELERQR